MARYRRLTTTTTSIIQGVPSTIDTIQELASFVNENAIINVDINGLDLVIDRNNGTQDVIDLTPIATGEVSAVSIISTNLNNGTLTLTKSDNTEFSVDLKQLQFIVTPSLVGNDLIFTDSLGSTISIDLTSFDQTVSVNSLSTRISSEEISRIAGDNSLSGSINSLSTRIDNSGSTYDDTAVYGEISTVKTSLDGRIDGISIPSEFDSSSLTTRVSSVESTVNGISIPSEFDSSSLTTRISSVESTVDGISIPSEFDSSSLTSRISTEESVRELDDTSISQSINQRFSNISGSIYDDTSLTTRVSSIESSVDGISVPTDVSDLTDNGGLLNGTTYDDTSIESRVSLTENVNSSLDSRISTEESNRVLSDVSQNTSIDQRFTNLSDSTYNDTSLTTRVSSVESVVNGISIPSEFDPSSLEDRVSVEKVGRIAGDNSLTIRVSQLEVADPSIDSRISTEESSRISGDTSIDQRFSNLSGSIYNDTSLVSRVSTLEDTVGDISIPSEFDSTSLTTRLSSVESTVNGISIPSEFDSSSIETRITTNDTHIASINNRVSTKEILISDVSTELASLSIPSEFNSSSLTTRISAMEIVHDLDEQSINTKISSNSSTIASLDNKLSLTETNFSSDISSLTSLIGGLQTVVNSQQSTIVSLGDKIEECCDGPEPTTTTTTTDSSTTTTTTESPTTTTTTTESPTTTTTTTQSGTTTTTTTLNSSNSYLLYADAGPGAGQVLYNSSNQQFYPFLVQNSPTNFNDFVTDRLNNSNNITIFSHDVCADKNTVTFSLNFPGSTNGVQAFYLHPSSQGTIVNILDTNNNTTYSVTPSSGQSVTIGGTNYTLYRWLQPQPNGSTFSIKVNNCL